jgi:hypothetical protein
MIKIGYYAKYHGKIDGVYIGKGLRPSRWSFVTILDVNGAYVKIRGKISWGGWHVVWVNGRDLRESAFRPRPEDALDNK